MSVLVNERSIFMELSTFCMLCGLVGRKSVIIHDFPVRVEFSKSKNQPLKHLEAPKFQNLNSMTVNTTCQELKYLQTSQNTVIYYFSVSLNITVINWVLNFGLLNIAVL